MTPYTLYINLYDLAFLVTISIGLTFSLQLWFAKKANRSANRFLALALALTVLWIFKLLCADIWLSGHFPHWLPLQFSLALGPLIFFYVLKITRPDYKFRFRDLLHFSPVLLEVIIRLTYRQLIPLVNLLAFISVIIYLRRSQRMIESFYKQQKFNYLSDRYRYQLRWLHRLLVSFGLLWLLWVPFTAIDYFDYHNQQGIAFYYPLYFLLMLMIFWIAAVALFRPEVTASEITFVPKTLLRSELKQKGTWLKNAMKAGLYHQDPELSLSSLAEKIDIHPHELSRIINTALRKNFNDFVNEYRVAEVTRKMLDPAYSNLTLLGIAFESGFNSKTTFNRTFRQITGKAPAEYKSELKKERPTYHLERHSYSTAIISGHETIQTWSHESLNRNYMIRNYLKIAWRNLVRNKVYSALNIAGLAAGMAVTIIIGLWIWDELSFDKYHQNYDRIAQVMKNSTTNGIVSTYKGLPMPLADELKSTYGSHFKYLVLSKTASHLLAAGDKKLSKTGSFMESPAPEMLTLNMLKGTRAGLKELGSILLSNSLSQSLFGDSDPIGKLIILDTKINVKITGVYEDLPYNTTFNDVAFIAPWELYATQYDWPKTAKNSWGINSFQIFAQVAGQEDISAVSEKIKNAITKKNGPFVGDPELFLQPMSRWHLYSEFKNGVSAGGRIQYVWLFGIIGAFVLLLACINFMNLSTARSEKRAKEVGIRKAIGSFRGQLIGQFFCESLLVAGFACLLSILVVQLSLPYFNALADKQMTMLWGNPLFWLFVLLFTLLTGLIAGSYPAFYLSSFKPITVLKGIFRSGRYAAVPRRVLVVLQFTISISLIIGTLVVFRQVQFTKNRPVGYSREGLLMLETTTTSLHDHFRAFSYDLLKSRAVIAVAESNSPATGVWDSQSGFEWEGKDPSLIADFAVIAITKTYGKAVGWQLKEGRDFSDAFPSDSSGIIMNETAVKFTGLKNPVGATIRQGSSSYHVIGVIKDMLMESPYEPVKQTMFYLDKGTIVNFKINPELGTAEALTRIGAVFKKYDPAEPFDYRFVDEQYAKKFDDEQRLGELAASFATLAILISCIGLFGMAAFISGQRVKEMGIRKVLGASVFSLWNLLSKDFLLLVMIAFLIACPITYFGMFKWLQHYTYHTPIAWWIYAATGFGSLVITTLTVSYQSIRAALTNPSHSLKTE